MTSINSAGLSLAHETNFDIEKEVGSEAKTKTGLFPTLNTTQHSCIN
jgi:hypothetical protein